MPDILCPAFSLAYSQRKDKMPEKNQFENILREAKDGKRSAIELVIEYYEPLARKVATYFKNRLSDGDSHYDDFLQEARISLLSSIDKFEIDKGGQFTYFAEYAMKVSIRSYLNNNYRTIKQPKGRNEKVVKLNKAYSALALDGIMNPSDEELIEKTGFNSKELKKVRSDRELQCTFSLDYKDEDVDENKNLMDVVPYYDSAEDELFAKEIKSYLERIEWKKRYVLCSLMAIFGYEKRSAKELAAMFSVSITTIKNWEKAAIGELRAYVA